MLSCDSAPGLTDKQTDKQTNGHWDKYTIDQMKQLESFLEEKNSLSCCHVF